jgi:peptidoglycan/LPS O-acetylase OafA/YrhL
MQLIQSIQAVRAFAALAIVWGHCRTGVLTTPNLYGFRPDDFVIPPVFYNLPSSGIDAFFIISGVIITTQCWNKFGDGSQWEFFKRRVTRLMPTYWTYFVITTVWLLINEHAFAGKKMVTLYKFLCSILLIPVEYGISNAGLILGQAWTLHFEISFYFLIFISLFFPRKFMIPFVGGMIALGALGLFSQVPHFFMMDVMTSTLLFEVFFGVCIGALYSHGTRVPAWICHTALVLSGILYIQAYNWPLPLARAFQWGIPAAFLVFGLLFLERLGHLRVPALLVDLGTSSYSIYLAHVTIILIVGRILYELGIVRFFQADLFVGVCTAISFAIGHWLCLRMDKPLAGAMRRLVMGGQQKTEEKSRG